MRPTKDLNTKIKFSRYQFFAFLSVMLFGNFSDAQLNANGGYLMGNQCEIGIHNHGHEGTFDISGSNSRTNTSNPEVYLGFVANPQNDGWVNYDGDFFTPGSPENGFGLEINGVNYSNNGYDPLSWGSVQYEIPGSLSNYQQIGNCISVQWDGDINNVHVQLIYSLNILELFYTTEVTLTNNTGSTLTDLYYYRNLDPDNNEEINSQYATQNTVVAQPIPGCEKALVSATQSSPWTSYIGLAAVGPDFRVAYGGFSNRDASDIWNGTAGLTGIQGSTSYNDEAIALAYKISTLPAGASETFQFGVILDQNQIDAAIASLFFFDYSGGTGVPTFCVPAVDTVFTCSGIPTTISVEGPNTSGYNWVWTPPTDLSTTTGSTTEAAPTSTITYTVTGTATGGCLSGTIVKQIVVDLNAGPIINIVDPGPQCGNFDLTTLVITDLNNTPGTITEFFGVIPDSASQVVGIWPSNFINDGEIVYVMIGDPSTGCFSYQQVIIDFSGSGSAGSDTTNALCNILGTTFDLDTYLAPGSATNGDWTETTMPASGQFNPVSAFFNGAGLAGTYTFTYIVQGVAGCPDDTSNVNIVLFAQPIADFEYLANGQSSATGLTSVCITNLITFDNNSFVSGGGSVITSNDWDYGNSAGSTLTNPTYQYPSTGTYIIELTVETNQGCIDSYSMPITITTSPTMALTIGSPSCYGFNDGSLTVNTAGGGPYTYIITNSAGTQINMLNTNTVNQIGAGWYYLNVDDGSGCAGIDSVYIAQPNQLAIDLVVNQPLCYGFETGLAFVDNVYNYTGSLNDISYFWNPNPNGINGIGQDSCVALGPGDYALTINDASGCSEVFDFVISYPDSVYFVQLGVEPAYCRSFYYQTGHGVVYAAASGDNPNYSYLWTNLTTGATSSNTTWGGLNPGNYNILVTNNFGCTLTATVTVDSLNPFPDFEMTSPEFTTMYEGTAPVTVHFVNQSLNFANPNDPLADTTFFWNFNFDNSAWVVSHDLNQTYDTTYTEGGEYKVCLVVINSNNCKDTLCKDLIIYDPLLFTPINIFTPDGDGINDAFTFRNFAQAVSEFNCLIVDRWGVEMFEMTNITDEWNGQDKNGDACTDGVYFYTYEGTADNGTEFNGQGNVQIIHSK